MRFIPKHLIIEAEKFDSSKPPQNAIQKNGKWFLTEKRKTWIDERPNDMPDEITIEKPIQHNDFIVTINNKKIVLTETELNRDFIAL
jgi:hypothetical protein